MDIDSRSGKRKSPEISKDSPSFPMNDLNEDLLERVLSWLPTSSFFRLTSVCKRWKSVANSTMFNLACSEVPSRDPWFFMVDSKPRLTSQPIIFDSAELNWKKLNPLHLPELNQSNFIPVSSSGGLICFHNPTNNNLIVTNPVTGKLRQLASFDPITNPQIQAISILSKSDSFKLFIITGELSNMKLHEYNSKIDKWNNEIALTEKPQLKTLEEESPQYFLTKCGDVASTDIQRTPCKQYSSILTNINGDEILYFLNSSGKVVSCNFTNKLFFQYPRLLHLYSEFSIDIVEYMGEMHVVLLSEFMESASVRMWRWDEASEVWDQIAAMPPWMSHKFYGKKVDLNCSGAGNQIMICLNSCEEDCSYVVMYSFVSNEWIELPNCKLNGKDEEFVCGFSFEPRIEVSV